MALSIPKQHDHLSSLSRLSYPLTSPFFNVSFATFIPTFWNSRQLLLLPQFSSTRLLVHSRSKINYRIRLTDQELSGINFVKSFIRSIHIVPRLFFFKFVPKNFEQIHTHSNLYLTLHQPAKRKTMEMIQNICYINDITLTLLLKKNFFLLSDWSLLLQLLQHIINKYSIYKIILLATSLKLYIFQVRIRSSISYIYI